ncbi:PqqD family protein [Caldifermentibacillus hisashii]|jgi:hypothetical protein|uniref:Coenzyme PQQ synthesis protein D (PqqD) n=1 Tax=Melghiribacillus thermohalophilus TaxID=1324956 RepID=A0A4R3MRX9_9BACI|nr:PqqD family protein [Melghiribacillus thermohalophilus]TCT17491.1 coenzyme PQQ synthesis protein D (PqqD) [Melghiribacillus thermohalophilus]
MLVKKNIAFRVRKISGKNILIGGYKAYELNETGLLIWEFISSPKSIEEIAESLSKEYEINVSEVINDVNEYVNYLLSVDALVKVGE